MSWDSRRDDTLRIGRSTFAAWEDDLFETFWKDAACPLHAKLKAQPGADAVLDGFLKLGCEAVGRGYIRPSGAANRLLQRMLSVDLPKGLPAVAAERRIACMSRMWNLGERLLSEPKWVQDFLYGALPVGLALEQWEKTLETHLEAMLSPAPLARWDGPFVVKVLDTRNVLDEFLPGDMWMGAPRVLCVRGRRGASHVAVALRHGGKSSVVGTTTAMPVQDDDRSLPNLSFEEGALLINERKVMLPRLTEMHRCAPAACGFVVISAEDSQRLWVVESP